MKNNEKDNKKQLKIDDEEDLYKYFTKEEYETMMKKDIQEMIELRKQLAAERAAEDEKFSKMTGEEIDAYLWERNQKLYADINGKFKDTIELTSKEEKKGEK